MARQKKDCRNLNVKLKSGIYIRFEKYCDDLGQTKTTALERILDKHLSEYEEKLTHEQSGNL